MNVPEIDPSPGIDIGKMDRKIWWRIIPFILVLYVISILDRINIGYAALTMNAELGIDPFLFGFISGIFFISYILFEVPGNQILARTGARIWLFRIMVSWGIIAMLMAVVSTPLELGILRFFLGATEASFAPGLILYLSFWFRKEKIAKALAVFFIAIPLAMMIASPLSAFILSHASWFEISGWRWLFLLEGLPAVFFGCAILVCLSDLPEIDCIPKTTIVIRVSAADAEPITSPDRRQTIRIHSPVPSREERLKEIILCHADK